MQTSTTNTSLIVSNLANQSKQILDQSSSHQLSAREQRQQQFRQLATVAQINRLIQEVEVPRDVAWKYPLRRIGKFYEKRAKQVQERADKVQKKADEYRKKVELIKEIKGQSRVDALLIKEAHQTRRKNQQEDLPGFSIFDEEKPVKDRKKKEGRRSQGKNETRRAIQEYSQPQATTTTKKKETKAGEAHSNTFVELDGKEYSFHEVAGAYLGQETRALKDATETKQDADNKSIDENQLPEVKLRELAKAFFVTMPKEFLAELLSVMDIEHNETKVLKLRDELLNNKFRPLKESFKRLLDNNSKNLNWDSIIKIFRNEMKKKKWKEGKILDTSRITKGISQNFISRLESTWKNQGHLTRKPTEVAI